MHPLRLEVDGRVILVDSPRVVRIGRSPDADVLLTGETVSRMHAELRPTDLGWILVDVGSQHGTYVSGQRITELRVIPPLTIACGLQGSGSTLLIAAAEEQASLSAATINQAPGYHARDPHPLVVPPVQPPQPPPAAERPPVPTLPQHAQPAAAVPSPPAQFDPGYAVTMAVEVTPPSAGAPQGPMTGPDVLVRADGKDQRFRHPALVIIGRHPDCTVVVSDPVASRYHGRIDAVAGGWTYTNTCRAGTYVDGRKTDTLKLEDSTSLRLGHPVSGPEVVVTPVRAAHEAEQRITRQRRRRTLRRIAGAAAALVLVGAVVFGAFLFFGGDEKSPPATAGPDELTATELDNAKLATVLIFAEGQTVSGGTASWSGSGSIMTPDGMILTNAHVAEPQAEGLAEVYGPSDLLNPEFLQIALIRTANDAPADPTYRARVVQSDGRLDASVLQIYATIDGGELPGQLDLPTVPIGDSDELRTGDEVTILGFPSISQSAGVSITRGVISTFVSDPALNSDRAEIDTDARIAPGNSGGLAINNAGEIIGIPSATYELAGSPVQSGRIRPINLVKPIIEGAR